jgi:RNA polymerase sigma-70 factor (ECF subfamily)
VVRGESQEKNAVMVTIDLFRVAPRDPNGKIFAERFNLDRSQRTYIKLDAPIGGRAIGMMLFFPILMAVQGGADDTNLVQRMQQRDPRALAELYDRYGRVVYSLILRVVRDAGIAEDLVQEAFLRVWNRVNGFDAQKGSIGPWLLAVARNRAIDYLRSAAGRERKSVEYEEIEHPSLFCDMEKDILTSDKARIVKSALAKLSPNYRQVIELAYFEGLSQTEMAERMGQPLGTVKTWVRTALKNLRDELGAVVSA